MVQKCMKVQAKHGKVTQNMHGASRNYRYVWDVSPPGRCIQTFGMICSVIINLLISFLKTATIPTYQGISIVFPRYIAMQHPPSHDLIFMSYMFLLHWQRHTFAYIVIATSSLC